MMVANVTAVQNGETVLDHEDASDADLSSLLQFGEKIVIHEVHDEDELETVKTRAEPGWWEETVEFGEADGVPEKKEDERPEPRAVVSENGTLDVPDIGVRGRCAHSRCEDDADVAVRVNTGQVRHYCAEHKRIADMEGRMVVEEESELRPVEDGRGDGECPYCGSNDAPEDGIVVGSLGPRGTNKTCTVCRADYLRENTVLSRREAEVAAHKQLTGASNQTIADRLGLEKSTVDEYMRRMKKKVRDAATTADELDVYL